MPGIILCALLWCKQVSMIMPYIQESGGGTVKAQAETLPCDRASAPNARGLNRQPLPIL